MKKENILRMTKVVMMMMMMMMMMITVMLSNIIPLPKKSWKGRKPLMSIPKFILEYQSQLSVNKDKTVKRKQNQTVKVTIPLMKANVTSKEVVTEIKKKVSPGTFEKLTSISPQLHQSFRLLNASFTDIQGKR